MAREHIIKCLTTDQRIGYHGYGVVNIDEITLAQVEQCHIIQEHKSNYVVGDLVSYNKELCVVISCHNGMIDAICPKRGGKMVLNVSEVERWTTFADYKNDVWCSTQLECTYGNTKYLSILNSEDMTTLIKNLLWKPARGMFVRGAGFSGMIVQSYDSGVLGIYNFLENRVGQQNTSAVAEWRWPNIETWTKV